MDITECTFLPFVSDVTNSNRLEYKLIFCHGIKWHNTLHIGMWKNFLWQSSSNLAEWNKILLHLLNFLKMTGWRSRWTYIIHLILKFTTNTHKIRDSPKSLKKNLKQVSKWRVSTVHYQAEKSFRISSGLELLSYFILVIKCKCTRKSETTH